MEDDFRNLTANVWANLADPIKRYYFKGFINFVYVAISGGTLLIVQQSNGTVHIFFTKCYFS